MRAVDIFTPGKLPTVTLVRDQIERRKQDLQDALDQQLLVTISGPSKSGKTVFVKSLVGAGNIIAVTGAGVESPQHLWTKAFHAVGTTIPTSVSSETNSLVGGSVSAKGEVGIVIAKKELSGSISGSIGSKAVEAASNPVDLLQLLVKEFAGSGFVIFIDDFHYIPRDVQPAVAAQIKDAIASGVQIVCASVPYHSEDLLRANQDLQGRIFAIDFDYWDTDALMKIGEQGFVELNIEVERDLLRAFAGEAAGSPQLMQSICLNASFELGARQKLDTKLHVEFGGELVRRICNRTSSADFSSTIERCSEGPKTRGTDRKSFRLADGDVGDVYACVLRAIASDPPQLRFLYADLLARIRGVVEAGQETPSGSSTSGACLHIAQLANDGQPKQIIEWDSHRETLDVRDPYLLFYLRWSDTVRKLS
ncbi:hypothetical protein [Paraburkholderia sp. BL17N1]|uniref:hypothetical protein n=1 Tax=Paraburkholderia sp. BL17N1 TaxID=1938798 RepID=UPI000EAB8F47|nr:hypothetical protein [Paraburkholderia sp. BL17N1]RKR46124.1 hypothetical protein B0G82_3803 [Paraburkholderia sp. BL17N1]